MRDTYIDGFIEKYHTRVAIYSKVHCVFGLSRQQAVVDHRVVAIVDVRGGYPHHFSSQGQILRHRLGIRLYARPRSPEKQNNVIWKYVCIDRFLKSLFPTSVSSPSLNKSTTCACVQRYKLNATKEAAIRAVKVGFSIL